MWELDHRESWAPKNWCFWTVVLEKTLENPLESKEIRPVSHKGNQSWIFIERTDAEAEAPVLWPPDAKNWLTGKDTAAGKDWRWEEKGTTKDEMVTQWTWVWACWGDWWCTGKPGVPWGRKESDMTEWLNWQLIYNVMLASAIWQNESVIHLHISTLFRFFSHISHCRVLSRVPTHYVPISYQKLLFLTKRLKVCPVGRALPHQFPHEWSPVTLHEEEFHTSIGMRGSSLLIVICFTPVRSPVCHSSLESVLQTTDLVIISLSLSSSLMCSVLCLRHSQAEHLQWESDGHLPGSSPFFRLIPLLIYLFCSQSSLPLYQPLDFSLIN